MYSHKSTAAVAGVSTAGLAHTGANTILLVLAAIVAIICGFTLLRLSRSRPSEVLTGPSRTRHWVPWRKR